MNKDGFREVFHESDKLLDFLHTICFGFSKEFRLYWKALEYDKTNDAAFVIALFPSGSIRVMSNDRGDVGHDPEAIYCKIRTVHIERFDVEPKMLPSSRTTAYKHINQNNIKLHYLSLFPLRWLT